jgi:hypothetical protein
MLPNPLVATLMLRRGARIWFVARSAISGVILLSGDDPLRLPIGTTVAVLLISVTLGYVELYRNHERDLIGNLGVKRRTIGALFLGPALLGELLVRSLSPAG